MSKISSPLLLGCTGPTKIAEGEFGLIQAFGDERYEKVEDEGGRASDDIWNEYFNQEFHQILCVLLLI